MIDLEREPEALLDPRCDPAQITCLGAVLNGPALAIARSSVVGVTFAPQVKSLSLTVGSAPEYTGFDKHPVDPEHVYASVIYGSGVLHTDADVSFTIVRSRVQQISLYGRRLAELGRLSTLAKLHQSFGVPDRCLRLEAEGDLLGYDSYYAASRKWVRWLVVSARPTAVIFGAAADAVRAGDRGGVSRTLTSGDLPIHEVAKTASRDVSQGSQTAVQTCPRCRLLSPQETQRCDCGHSFLSGSHARPVTRQAARPEDQGRIARFVLRYPRPVGAVVLTFGALLLAAMVSTPAREAAAPVRLSFKAIAFAALFVAAGGTTVIFGKSAAYFLIEKDEDPNWSPLSFWMLGCALAIFVGVLWYLGTHGYVIAR